MLVGLGFILGIKWAWDSVEDDVEDVDLLVLDMCELMMMFILLRYYVYVTVIYYNILIIISLSHRVINIYKYYSSFFVCLENSEIH